MFQENIMKSILLNSNKMRIKYIPNPDIRIKEFNSFVCSNFPLLLTERNPELYLVAGGDGSMLTAIHKTIGSKIPYLGKAMGTLNFLMNKFDNDYEIISDLLNDNIKIETFKSHAIEAELDGKKLGEAVNDVILGDSITGYHTFNITTEYGDFKDFEVKGSGICISTAIGSTAYNFNNNGNILPLDSCLLSITGVVCNRYLKDILPFQEIRIRSNGSRIFLTNIESEILSEGSELVLRKGTEVNLAFLNKTEFVQRRIDMAHRYRK